MIICRCEEVTEKEIIEAIKEGAVTVDEVRRRTRAGMGLCQGRTCRKHVMRIISRETGIPLSKLSSETQRPPVRPLKIDLLLQGKNKRRKPEGWKTRKPEHS